MQRRNVCHPSGMFHCHLEVAPESLHTLSIVEVGGAVLGDTHVNQNPPLFSYSVNKLDLEYNENCNGHEMNIQCRIHHETWYRSPNTTLKMIVIKYNSCNIFSNTISIKLQFFGKSLKFSQS